MSYLVIPKVAFSQTAFVQIEHVYNVFLLSTPLIFQLNYSSDLSHLSISGERFFVSVHPVKISWSVNIFMKMYTSIQRLVNNLLKNIDIRFNIGL